MGNIFVKNTIDALQIEEGNIRIAPRGFEIYDEDDKKGKCILIMGLNPANDNNALKGDAYREGKMDKNKMVYYASIGQDVKSVDLGNWLYNPYFSKIYEFAQSILGDNVKWSWCNIDWNVLNEQLSAPIVNNDGEEIKIEKEIKEKIEKHHTDNKNHDYTIYFGDMFYYHETNSKALPINNAYIEKKDYYRYMLAMHIKEIKKHKKNIEFIYCNNAKVSNALREKYGEKDDATYITVEDVRVFLGGMLSGQHPMDMSSRIRLIKEIKDYLENKR